MSSKDNKEKIPIPLTNRKREHFFGPRVGWSKTVLDYILNPTLWIPELLVFEFFVTGTWIPDSGFYQQNFPGFQNLHYLAWRNFFRGRAVCSLHCSHTNIQKDLLPEKSSCKSSMAYLACTPGTFQRWLMFCKLLFANKLHVDLHRDNINNQNIIELDATYDFTSRNYSNHQSINMFEEEKRDRF